MKEPEQSVERQPAASAFLVEREAGAPLLERGARMDRRAPASATRTGAGKSAQFVPMGSARRLLAEYTAVLCTHYELCL